MFQSGALKAKHRQTLIYLLPLYYLFKRLILALVPSSFPLLILEAAG